MSAKDFRFLSVENVLQIHDNTVTQEGGKRGLRDRNLLESAVAIPQSTLFGEYLHPGLSGKAAAYLFHLCQNHPFSDGNKRTAVLSLLLFLALNGIPDDALPPEEDMERVTFAVASSQMTKDQIIEWLQSLGI